MERTAGQLYARTKATFQGKPVWFCIPISYFQFMDEGAQLIDGNIPTELVDTTELHSIAACDMYGMIFNSKNETIGKLEDLVKFDELQSLIDFMSFGRIEFNRQHPESLFVYFESFEKLNEVKHFVGTMRQFGEHIYALPIKGLYNVIEIRFEVLRAHIFDNTPLEQKSYTTSQSVN